MFILITQNDTLINQEIPEVYNYITNYGLLGGERWQAKWGLSWPGTSPVNNAYSNEVEFAFGVKVNGIKYVTTNYFNYHPYYKREWAAGEVIFHGPGVSEEDVILYWHDFIQNPHNPSRRHTGIKVICRIYTWSNEPWNDFIPYEFFVIWDKTQCDIPGVGDVLDSVFIGILCNFDISNADPTDPWQDDFAFFDGYVAGEWDTLGYPYDSITLLPDSFITSPDGIYDQYIVYGDNIWENTLHNDTLILPRNLGYMWDGDDPFTPGNDTGENGKSAGYAGVALLYSPPSIADTYFICPHCGDTCRIPRIWAFQWWIDFPGLPHPSDTFLYTYLSGSFQTSLGKRFFYRYMETPYMWCSISSGPFKIADSETLKFVVVLPIGQGLNGGDDDYYGRDWIRGLRQTVDYALAAYYTGSEISDPYHPSGPDEDIHWRILKISEKNYKKFYLYLSSILTSSFLFAPKDNLKVEIFNISGEKLKETEIKGNTRLFKNMRKGIYFLRFNKGEKYKKIILIK